jgi:hypothetical protein
MKLLIIQTSPQHTASTFLINAIYGLIPELFNKKIIGIWDENFETYFENIIAVKNHDINIDGLINKYNTFRPTEAPSHSPSCEPSVPPLACPSITPTTSSPTEEPSHSPSCEPSVPPLASPSNNTAYKVVFICSERKDKGYLIDAKYKTYDNVAIFDFNELNETTTNTLIEIVDNIYNKVTKILPDVELDTKKCIERIQLMNNRYEEIKDLPFSYIDGFFEIHGSHRNRG